MGKDQSEAELRRLYEAWEKATDRAAALIRSERKTQFDDTRIREAQAEADAIVRRYEELLGALRKTSQPAEGDAKLAPTPRNCHVSAAQTLRRSNRPS